MPRAEANEVFDSLRRIVRHLRLAANASESAAGMSTAQLFVLSRLAEAKATSIRELAVRTMTDPSSVSVVVAKLEARGLVERTPDATDRRRALLSLTAAGKKLLAKAPELPQVRLLEAVEALPTARRRAIVSALSDLVTALGAEAAEPQFFFEDEPSRSRGSKTSSARKR
ncbi:MarR family winged helix-turn-helix transcriptional regulator [Labilithrix luteola]|uniref:MarR family winged helix-turn-helix transcriptional regulator n=1 Tax=Labilithrix luteola TaxID=1391654 RepID=UPI001474B927|nr:MarR family transcriptional regulator [Labilithrix luteola]